MREIYKRVVIFTFAVSCSILHSHCVFAQTQSHTVTMDWMGFADDFEQDFGSELRDTGAGALTSASRWSAGSVVTDGTKALELSSATSVGGHSEWTDISYRAKMKTVTPGADSWNVGRLLFRYQDANNYYALLLHNNAGGTLELAANKAGVWSPGLASVNTNLDEAAWHNFRILVRGANIRVWVDGVEYVNYTDGTPVNSGKVGMVGDVSTARLDDVSVTPLVTSTTGRCLADGTLDNYRFLLTDTTNYKTRLYKFGNVVSSLWRLQGVRTYGDFDDTTDPYASATKVNGVSMWPNENVDCTNNNAAMFHAREEGETSIGYGMLERIFNIKGYANTALPSFSMTSSDLQFSTKFNSCFGGAGSACDWDGGASDVVLFSYLVPEDGTQGGLRRERFNYDNIWENEAWGQPFILPDGWENVTTNVGTCDGACSSSPCFCFNWGTGAGWSGGPTDYWTSRYDGKINIPADGNWDFRCGADDGCRVFIDGEIWTTLWRSGSFGYSTWAATAWGQTLPLKKGMHDIRVEYLDKNSNARLEVQWSGPGYSGAVPLSYLYYPSDVYKLKGAQTNRLNAASSASWRDGNCGTNKSGYRGCDYIKAWDPEYAEGNNPSSDTASDTSITQYCTDAGHTAACSGSSLNNFFNNIGTTLRGYKLRFYTPIWIQPSGHEKFALFIDDIRFNMTYQYSWPSPTFSITSRSWGNTDVSVTVTYPETVDEEYTRHCWNNGSTCDPGTTNANTFTNGQTLTQSSEGQWYLCTRARDMRGNWSDATCNGLYQIDKTAPPVTFNNPASASWQKADFSIDVSDSDALSGLSTCQFQVESYSGSWSVTRTYTARTCNSATSATVTVGSAAYCQNEGTGDNGNGACRVTVRATDAASNTTTLSARQFKIDWTAPTFGAVTPANTDANSHVDGTYDVSATFADPTSGVSSCEYTTDGSAWAAGAWSSGTCSKTGITCADGAALTLNMRATDAAGNVGTATSVARTCDTNAPAFSLTSWDTGCAGTQYTNNESYSDSTPTFCYTATDARAGLHATTPYTYVFGTDCAATPSTTTTSSSYDAAIASNATKNCFRVFAKDAVGNTSSPSTFTYMYNTQTPSWRYPGVGSQVGAFYGGGTIRTYGGEQRYYVASNTGTFYAIEASAGTVRWSLDISAYGGVSAAPLVFGGKIYLGTEGGVVLRLVDNGASATVEANRDLGVCAIQSATMTISVGGATKILAGCGTDLYALNDDATFTNWANWSANPRTLTGSVTKSIPAFVNLSGGTDPWVYVATQDGTLSDANYGRVYKIDVDNGVISTTFDDSADFTGYLILRTYFGDSKQYLFAGGVKNPESSSRFYALDTTSMPSACGAGCIPFNDGGAATGFEGGAAVSSGGSVAYVGNNNGKLYRLNFNGSALTKAYEFNAASAIQYGVTFRQAGGKLYFGTSDGVFFIVTDNGASFTENLRYHTGDSVSATPAVNAAANKVVVPSIIGRIFSFAL